MKQVEDSNLACGFCNGKKLLLKIDLTNGQGISLYCQNCNTEHLVCNIQVKDNKSSWIINSDVMELNL